MQLVFLHSLKLGNSINLQLGCISLLKSKSGFLIPKWIFHFFTKSNNRLLIQMIHNEVDSLDHIQNRML